MNFIEAIQFANSGISVRRKGWADGVRLSVHKDPGYKEKGMGFREDEIRVYHVATCAVPLTATDVLSYDWETMISLPNWFEVNKKVKHKSSDSVYHIISIRDDVWVGRWDGFDSDGWDGFDSDGTYEYEFTLCNIEKTWSPVE